MQVNMTSCLLSEAAYCDLKTTLEIEREVGLNLEETW